MIIRKLKLKNFGVHKNVEFNTEGKRIIGLLGKNGSGKSTILSAIKFAFTSDIPGTIESNLRVGSKSGNVEIEFMFNGEIGTISRSIGKTSKAKLIWKGKEYTVKKDIEATLFQIMGVDKKSLSSAVFLSQGSLNNLLFGSDADREELFIKVMNMSYCQKFSDVLDQKSKTLLDGTDNLAVIDELNRQRIALSERLDVYKVDLKKYPNCEKAIESLEKKARISNLLAQTIENINTDELHISQLKADLKKVNHEKIDNADLVKSDQLLKDSEYTIDSYENFIDIKEHIKIAEEHIDTQTNIINDANLELDDLESKLLSLAEKGEWDNLGEHIAQAKVKVDLISKWKEAQVAALNGKLKETQCYTCGAAHTISEDSIKKLDTEIIELTESQLSMSEKLSLYRDEIQSLKSKISQKGKERHVAQQRLEDNEASIVRLNEKINHLPTLTEKEAVDTLKKKKEEHVKLMEHVHSIRSVINESNIIKGKIETKQTDVENGNLLIKSLQEQINETQVTDKSLLELREIDRINKDLHAKLSELDDQYKEINQRYNNMLDQNEEAERKKKVHEELQKLKNVFSRKGLPKAYVDARFKILTELTQKNLEELETDFFITQSEDKSLAFDYSINYGDEHINLPMHKLSGGQRVRLSLAFILAVQQLVVAELGFVTLDEPSTHLDEEGVDSLCNLLKKVRDVFADSEHQLWVCDHNPKLDIAFDKILKLT